MSRAKEDKKQRKRPKKGTQDERNGDDSDVKLQEVLDEDLVHRDDDIPDIKEEDAEKEKACATASPTKEKKDEESEEDDGVGTKKKRKRKRKRKTTTEDDGGAGGTIPNDDARAGEAPDVHRDAVEHTVYVEGIPFDVTVDRVREFFESNGVDGILELRLPTWQDSGRLRGYGHVRLGSKESCDRALKLSGAYLNRRYLTIQPANVPGGDAAEGHSSFSFTESADTTPSPKDCRTLFVTNLPYSAAEDDLTNLFSEYGTIAEDGVRIARNSVSRQSKGFAYIDFATSLDAQKVIEVATKRALKIEGRIVRLDYDTGRIKGSFRTDSGKLWTKETKGKKSV